MKLDIVKIDGLDCFIQFIYWDVNSSGAALVVSGNFSPDESQANEFRGHMFFDLDVGMEFYEISDAEMEALKNLCNQGFTFDYRLNRNSDFQYPNDRYQTLEQAVDAFKGLL